MEVAGHTIIVRTYQHGVYDLHLWESPGNLSGILGSVPEKLGLMVTALPEPFLTPSWGLLNVRPPYLPLIRLDNTLLPMNYDLYDLFILFSLFYFLFHLFFFVTWLRLFSKFLIVPHDIQPLFLGTETFIPFILLGTWIFKCN